MQSTESYNMYITLNPNYFSISVIHSRFMVSSSNGSMNCQLNRERLRNYYFIQAKRKIVIKDKNCLCFYIVPKSV